MAYKTELNLTFGYEDETTRKFSVGPYPEISTSEASVIKAAIKNFNANDVDDIAGLILSDAGASCTGIVAAGMTMTDSREINLNDE